MSEAKNELEKAGEHLSCASLLLDRYPLQACGHVLSSISRAGTAASGGKVAAVSFEELPEQVYSRTNPVQMTNMTATLQGIVRNDDGTVAGLPEFARKSIEVAGTFINDVEDHLQLAASPKLG